MGQPFIGEIRMFAGNFAPMGWALCQGQLLQVSQNDGLFGLIGTTYGGDGQETFALPDLRGRVPVHAGAGPSGITRTLGESGGTETVALTMAQLPSHTHQAMAVNSQGNTASPGGAIWAMQPNTDIYSNLPPTNAMNPGAMAIAGGGQPHDNMLPFLAINFIISLFGLFPMA